MYELHEQVHQDRLAAAGRDTMRRQLIAQRRARRRLARAEQAALRARLVLSGVAVGPSVRIVDSAPQHGPHPLGLA